MCTHVTTPMEQAAGDDPSSSADADGGLRRNRGALATNNHNCFSAMFFIPTAVTAELLRRCAARCKPWLALRWAS